VCIIYSIFSHAYFVYLYVYFINSHAHSYFSKYSSLISIPTLYFHMHNSNIVYSHARFVYSHDIRLFACALHILARYSFIRMRASYTRTIFMFSHARFVYFYDIRLFACALQLLDDIHLFVCALCIFASVLLD